MMVDYEVNELLQENLPYNDTRAVFLSASDGKLKGVNQFAENLIDKIEFIDEFLPVDHRGLVRACLRTRMSLKRQCELDGIHLTWSYQAIDKMSNDILSKDLSDYVCIYGQGFSAEHAGGFDVSLPSLSPNSPMPNVRFSWSGELQFINSETSMLLDKLHIENIEDLLPCLHNDLLHACTVSEVSLVETRVRDGQRYDWIYESNAASCEINIYAQKTSEFSSEIYQVIPEQSGNSIFNLFVDELFSIKTINYATYRLLNELKLCGVDEILPSSHTGLIKACQTTRTILTKKCILSGRSIVWSYQPQPNGQGVSVLGYEV